MSNRYFKTNTAPTVLHFSSAAAVFALLLLCTSVASIAAAETSETQRTLSAVVAIPAPTPSQKWPGKLGRPDISRLADELKEVVANFVEDDNDVERITTKWEARKLAGVTKAEVLNFYFADVKAIVKDAETEKQIWDGWNAPEDANEEEGGNGTWVKVVHGGAFIAHFTVTWDEPGKPNQSATEKGKINGFTTTFEFPENTTNIRLKMENDTGLAWEPKREIFNRTLGKAGLNMCYKISGTTLNSTFDTSCTEGGRDDQVEEEGSSGLKWIKVVHSGAFIGHFEITWNVPGKPVQSRKESGKASGFQMTVELPQNAANVRLKMTNDTGLAWEPQRQIFDRTLQPTDLNKCYRITGTTMASSYDNNCR